MYAIEPLTFAHTCFIAANIRAADYAEWVAETGETKKFAIAYSSFFSSPEHLKWVYLYNNSPVAAAGFAPIYPHLASIWMFGIAASDKAFPRLAKYLLTVGREKAEKSGIRRVEARTLGRANSWLTRLGGTLEAVMPQYGVNGETFYLYSWVKTGE